MTFPLDPPPIVSEIQEAPHETLLDDATLLWQLQRLSERQITLMPIPLPRWYALSRS